MVYFTTEFWQNLLRNAMAKGAPFSNGYNDDNLEGFRCDLVEVFGSRHWGGRKKEKPQLGFPLFRSRFQRNSRLINCKSGALRLDQSVQLYKTLCLRGTIWKRMCNTSHNTRQIRLQYILNIQFTPRIYERMLRGVMGVRLSPLGTQPTSEPAVLVADDRRVRGSRWVRSDRCQSIRRNIDTVSPVHQNSHISSSGIKSGPP
jgi:hypothetical protein